MTLRALLEARAFFRRKSNHHIPPAMEDQRPLETGLATFAPFQRTGDILRRCYPLSESSECEGSEGSELLSESARGEAFRRKPKEAKQVQKAKDALPEGREEASPLAGGRPSRRKGRSFTSGGEEANLFHQARLRRILKEARGTRA